MVEVRTVLKAQEMRATCTSWIVSWTRPSCRRPDSSSTTCRAGTGTEEFACRPCGCGRKSWEWWTLETWLLFTAPRLQQQLQYMAVRKDSAGHVASCARTSAIRGRAAKADAASARDQTTFTVVARSASRADCVTHTFACAGQAFAATNVN